MKKFRKFMFGTLSLATLAAGAYYVYKNYIKKDTSDDFDEFEDDFENFEDEEEAEEEFEATESREYVPLNLNPKEEEVPEVEPITTDAEDTEVELESLE